MVSKPLKMKTSLFIPTNRAGGIDVLENSLCFQSAGIDLLIVCDDYNADRFDLWKNLSEQLEVEQFTYFSSLKIKKYVRGLARAYNVAAKESLHFGADLMISLQDYMHIPVDGIERFKKAYEKMGDDYLYTGLVSIAGEPGLSAIKNLEHPYSIFNTPYRRFTLPTNIQWRDVRLEMYNSFFEQSNVVSTCDVNHWEANWAAIPTALFKRGLWWDESYDEGYAYENNDLARRAIKEYDCNIIIDAGNHAVSLPHFDYWPKEKEDLILYSNKDKYENDYLS